jgi:hypothetical protein
VVSNDQTLFGKSLITANKHRDRYSRVRTRPK